MDQIFRILHPATAATAVLDSGFGWDARKGEGGGRVKAPGTLSSARQIQENGVVVISPYLGRVESNSLLR